MASVSVVQLEPGNYVTETAAQRQSGAVAGPRGEDGRAASVDPAAQVAWGWGLAPAAAVEPVDKMLTRLPCDPVAYSVRQQDAVRRDQAAEIGCYADYRPAPFAGEL